MKKPEKRKSPAAQTAKAPRRRRTVSRTKAYYGFFSEYPSNVDANGYRENKAPPTKRRRRLRVVGAVFVVVLTFCLSFIIANSLYNYTHAPVSDGYGEDASANDGPIMVDGGMRGYYAPMADIVANPVALAREAKSRGADTIVTELKSADGKLAYVSSTETAAASNASGSAPAGVNDAATLLHESGMKACAMISCFSDSLAAEYIDGAGIYTSAFDLSPAGLWRDASGNAWLDPFNYQAVKYLTGVVSEIAAMGYDYIILNNVCLPATSGIHVPGAEGSYAGVNSALRSFIAGAAGAKKSAKLYLQLPFTALVGGADTVWGDGNMLRTAADAVAVDLRVSRQPKNFTIADRVFEDPGKIPFVFINDASNILMRIREETGETFVALLEDTATVDPQLEALAAAGVEGYALIP